MTGIEANQLFESFSAAGRATLLKSVREERYQDKETIFSEGDASDGLCALVDGSVEIVKAAGQRQQVLIHYHPGDYFGEISVLDGGGRTTSARACGEVVLAKIPREEFLAVLKTEPAEVTMHLFQRVLVALRQTGELFVREVVHKEKLSLVGEMASSLMHDLRNPLTGIGLSADMISMHHVDDSTTKSCETIRMQCDRVVAMAQELLEFSRDETRLQLGMTTTTAFLEHFYAMNEDYFAQCPAEVHLQAEPADIRIDSMRLLRLLQNLVTNAIQALGNRPEGRIEVSAWAQAGILYLKVKDNGPGIPDLVKANVFEPFVTQGKVRGTGLGLSIARNIVTAHGGTIAFDSESGKGTTFTIMLPQLSSTQQLPLVVSV